MVSSLETGIKCESHNSESGRHSNLSHFIIYNKCYVIHNTVYMLYINIYIFSDIPDFQMSGDKILIYDSLCNCRRVFR